VIGDPRLTAWLDIDLPRLLPPFLAGRRWFGGKARNVSAARIEDAVWLPDPQPRSALVIVRIHYADGTPDRYALVVAFVREPAGLPVLGPVESGSAPLWAVEAGADPESVLSLLRGFAPGAAPELDMLRGGRLTYRDADAIAARALDRGTRPAVEPVGGEQSNTSLRVNRTLAFKLIRKLEAGENPEVEIGRFLSTRTTFHAMPILRGSVEYRSPDGGLATAGILQDWIDSEGDGWSHIVALLEKSDQSGGESLRRDVTRLGDATAAFHAAIAADRTDPAFAPEPATPADAASWHASLLERGARTLDLVDRALPEWPEPARRLGARVIEARGWLEGTGVPSLGTGPTGFDKIRIHGDYHLGQTLKTAGGFVLIDFEGEPRRPLAERRAKQAALRDVAGMIRSFDYAVATAMPSDPDPTLTHQLRERFLAGYRSGILRRGASDIVPRDDGAFEAWVNFFELDKAFYEIDYEMNHRPDWVHIPLGGVLRIAEGWTRGSAPG
jgi:trehalose synthase-fused probable maltokinase